MMLGCSKILPFFFRSVIGQWEHWSPPPGCENGWGAFECCCHLCPASGFEHSMFTPKLLDECLNLGGQCKVPTMSSYVRGTAGKLANETFNHNGFSEKIEQVHMIGGYSD